MLLTFIITEVFLFALLYLFKAIKLNLTVAGNTALTAGNVIDLKIPSSTEEDEEVLLDYRFSGKYIIAGLTHIYQKTGLTTKLYLVRDSVPKQEA